MSRTTLIIVSLLAGAMAIASVFYLLIGEPWGDLPAPLYAIAGAGLGALIAVLLELSKQH